MKYRLLTICLLLSVTLSSQVIFEDNFSNGLSKKWTFYGDFTQNWSLVNTNAAGGESPEIKLSGTSPQLNLNKKCRMVSPVIDLSPYAGGEFLLTFKHNISSHGNICVGIAITTDNGKTWSELMKNTSYSSSKFRKKISFPEKDADKFQFCLFFSGDLHLLDAWSVDDVKLSLLPKVDIYPIKIVLEMPEDYEKEKTAFSPSVDNMDFVPGFNNYYYLRTTSSDKTRSSQSTPNSKDNVLSHNDQLSE